MGKKLLVSTAAVSSLLPLSAELRRPVELRGELNRALAQRPGKLLICRPEHLLLLCWPLFVSPLISAEPWVPVAFCPFPQGPAVSLTGRGAALQAGEAGSGHPGFAGLLR